MAEEERPSKDSNTFFVFPCLSLLSSFLLFSPPYFPFSPSPFFILLLSCPQDIGFAFGTFKRAIPGNIADVSRNGFVDQCAIVWIVPSLVHPFSRSFFPIDASFPLRTRLSFFRFSFVGLSCRGLIQLIQLALLHGVSVFRRA